MCERQLEKQNNETGECISDCKNLSEFWNVFPSP